MVEVEMSGAMEKSLRSIEWGRALGFLLVALLGCGDGGSTAAGGSGGAGGGRGPAGDDPVKASLEALGVDTTQTPRVDEVGEPLPDAYSPLGSRPFAVKLDELLIAGVTLTGRANSVNLFDGVPETRNSDGSIAEPFRFDAIEVGDDDWDSLDNPGIKNRAATSADVDGDGRDELVVVFQRMSDDRLYAFVQDDQEGGFARAETELLLDEARADLVAIELTTGDVDADGVFEVIAALVEAPASGMPSVTILVLDPVGGDRLTVDERLTRVIPAEQENSAVSVGLTSGNLDNDNHDEIAVVVNEIASNQGTASFYLYDASAEGLGLADSGFIDFLLGNEVARVKIGDCSIGDVDADGHQDLVLGGLIHVNTNCDNPPDVVAGAFRMTESGLEPSIDPVASASASLQCDSAGVVEVRAAFVNALDADGDGDSEVAVNQVVFDLDEAGESWSEIGRLNPSSFFPGLTGAYTLDRGNTAVAVGDVTADEKDDLIYVTENASVVDVWGARVDMAGELSFGRKATLPVSSGRAENPLLVPTNVDRDSYALVYEPSEYELIFTEPVIVAVLAAAPCFESGQNVDECTTSFGSTDISGNSQEYSLTLSASIIVGLSTGITVPIVKVEGESEHEISVALTATYGHEYTLEKSVTYTTGPLEDTVIFTSVPYDKYMYTILDHPDTELIGQRVAYLIPRDPVTLQVERSFYNQHAAQDGIPIDNTILSHAVGDPRSYPTASEKDQLLSQHGGLATNPQAVGQGEGSVELGLDVSEEHSAGGSLEIGYQYTAKATAAAAIAGFTVGASFEASLHWSWGTQSSYAGTVGNLSSESFADNQYSFGLFTYPLKHSYGQEFEVLNYWVE